MYCPRFELGAFDHLDHAAKIRVLLGLLEVLVEVNRCYLRLVPQTPDVLRAGVRYLKEPPDTDNWQDVPRTLQLGSGDCEDLAAYRVASLRELGESAGFQLAHFESGGVTFYHVRIVREDGSIEDPSRALGMV